MFQCVSRSKSNDSLGHLLLPLRRKEELFCFVRFSCDKVMPFILTSVITINDLIHHHGEYLTKVKTVLSNQSRRQQVSEAIMLLIALENCKKYYEWISKSQVFTSVSDESDHSGQCLKMNQNGRGKKCFQSTYTRKMMTKRFLNA